MFALTVQQKGLWDVACGSDLQEICNGTEDPALCLLGVDIYQRSLVIEALSLTDQDGEETSAEDFYNHKNYAS